VGTGSTTPAAVNDGSSDDTTLANDLVLALSRDSFTCSDTPFKTVTLTVTDEAGNSATDTANVNIQDTEDPTIVAIASSTQVLGATGTFTLTAGHVSSSITDNCGIQSVGLSKSLFTCQDAVGGVAQNVIVFALDNVRVFGCRNCPLPLPPPTSRCRCFC